ncbi:LysR family transcriptional regulator [Agrobacterium rubi]|uniref:LysR family transcriptional regulator n=1 Tax=Agrobacterium rubi TaxID=28099 RepID=A0AAE7R2R9_9HYPH|nr:LysR family transcriptional regulator [Agrobacterium rubi]NTE86512.1 LysR family transcriptional regulator [Agrobacterium rubi]NTF02444.1 LysR family transcriptional regulator [Agrobacterium rubi]NTF36689.1 LysR family transcriptional regulator [Agrobacterium rubi]OCJ55681.1 LysR family transcriptional regulator [Agrobacterium rubi]QTF99142.1 LysR family transcriptional regulator [Agrobacterium rubi]
MKDVNWDDLKLFHIVASEGGLASAAGLTGISAPTIGRRMLFLERTMGRTLFIRSQQGYRLAPDGLTLFERVQSMRRAALDISQWHSDAFALPIVSIASNIWMMGFIADRAGTLRGPQDGFRLCCKLFSAEDDLTYRRCMVAIFDAPPKQGNFATLKSVDVSYHAYRAENLRASNDAPWISIGTEVAVSNAETWVFRNHERTIHTWTNAPELLPKLIASGAGKGVLPSYIGDHLPGVVRDGEAIKELSHPLWLAFNDDDRHSPEMRTIIDRLAALLKHNESFFEGIVEIKKPSEASIIPFHRS